MPADSDSSEAAIDVQSRARRMARDDRSAGQRLADFARLQQASFRVLSESPEGYRHFFRRNLTARRVEMIDGVWQPVSPARRAQQP